MGTVSTPLAGLDKVNVAVRAERGREATGTVRFTHAVRTKAANLQAP
jgi:hypothetical protein